MESCPSVASEKEAENKELSQSQMFLPYEYPPILTIYMYKLAYDLKALYPMKNVSVRETWCGLYG